MQEVKAVHDKVRNGHNIQLPNKLADGDNYIHPISALSSSCQLPARSCCVLVGVEQSGTILVTSKDWHAKEDRAALQDGCSPNAAPYTLSMVWLPLRP